MKTITHIDGLSGAEEHGILQELNGVYKVKVTSPQYYQMKYWTRLAMDLPQEVEDYWKSLKHV